MTGSRRRQLPDLRPTAIWLCSLLTASLTSAASGEGAYETVHFLEVTDAVRAAADRHGADKVLLVCDIDNTLLAMRGDLGSDQWFEWQRYLLAHEPESEHLVAETFAGLLEAQGKLFTLGGMAPPETDLPEHVAAVQRLGVRTLVLTSRGDEYRDATERELRENGYDFARSVLPTRGLPTGVYMPYDPNAIEESGITAGEAARFRLGKPRGVSFSAGVFMSAGQHKGAMLLTVLAKCDEDFAAVVFVDDHGRHIVRVHDALTRRGVEVWAFHYRRQQTSVARFNYSDKRDVVRNWRRLENTLQAVFN